MTTEPGPIPTAPAARLAIIATLLDPCPPPDIAHGHLACPYGYDGIWPCPVTQAAMIAQGRDPDTELHQAITEGRAARTQLDH
jgi:hypothetical protein